MPDDADEWEQVVGRRWTWVLAALDLARDARIAEIGPGFSTKLAVGLSGLGFRGEVILVDSCDQARRSAVATYGRLLTGARVRSVASTAELPAAGVVDLVLGNHVLDDLLLGVLTPVPLAARLFGSMRPRSPCSPEFTGVWQEILGDPAALQQGAAEVVRGLLSVVEDVTPSWLVLNHYPSWRHAAAGLAGVHAAAGMVLTGLTERLAGDPRMVRVRTAHDDGMQWLTAGASRADQVRGTR